MNRAIQKDKKWAAVIQARLGSTRLPDKMILPFHNNKKLIEIVFENLLRVFPKEKIILATTANPKDKVLADIAASYGIEVYGGSEDNVLERFVETSIHFGLSHTLRICADNPFLIQKYLKQITERGINSNADYLAFFFKSGLPSIKSHCGFFAEWVSVAALKKVMLQTSDKLFLEHVTNFIYSHPDEFDIEKIKLPEEDFCGKVRLTIDTIEDFEISQQLYKTLNTFDEITIKGIKNSVLESSEYLERMQRIINEQKK